MSRRLPRSSPVISLWVRSANEPPYESVVNWRVAGVDGYVGNLNSERIEGDMTVADALIWLGTTMKLKGEDHE